MGQQSEFEYQEHFASRAQQGNFDPREQPRYWEPEQQNEAYQAGYAAAMRQHMEGLQGQKIYPQPRQRRRRRPLRIVVAIIFILILMLGGLGFFMSYFSMTNFQWVPLQSRTFSVRTMPKIIVMTSATTVTFHTGIGNMVGVTGSVTGIPTGNDNGQSNVVKLDAQQDINANTITINEQAYSSMSDQNMTLDITLPANSDIEATLSAGDINIDGVSGTMNVTTNAGNIDFQNGTLTGTSSFQDSGIITFHGSLANKGDYTFGNTAGPINLTLPVNSAFTLDAKNNPGNVSNAFGANRVGTHPSSQLHVKDSTGEITINKR
jgi:hypothetical protein